MTPTDQIRAACERAIALASEIDVLPPTDSLLRCQARAILGLLRDVEALQRRAPIMGSTGDYREGQLHALEAVSEMAHRAIANLAESLKEVL